VKLPSLGSGPFEPAMDDGVELRIDRLDAGDGGVDELEGLHLAGPDEPRQSNRVVIA
jgi:hypothetical protein